MNFFEIGHLAVPNFVKDLTRLGFLFRNHLDGLVLRKISQNTLGNPRGSPKALHGGDQSVPPKYRAEPRHAGLGIRTLGIAADHHDHVGL